MVHCSYRAWMSCTFNVLMSGYTSFVVSLLYHHRHVFWQPAEKLLTHLLPLPLPFPVASQSCQCLCRKQDPTLQCWQSETVCTERVSDTTCRLSTTAPNRPALFVWSLTGCCQADFLKMTVLFILANSIFTKKGMKREKTIVRLVWSEWGMDYTTYILQ